MGTTFPDDVESVLLAAGWHAGREVDTSPWRSQLAAEGVKMHEAADRFLAEFGNLTFDYRGVGLEVAPFNFDPARGIADLPRLVEWGEHLGVDLCPIGMIEPPVHHLAMDADGDCYFISSWAGRYGPWPEAVVKWIRGINYVEIPEEPEWGP
ncbi:SUKH-3 domain-containing protein [Actinokineospora globicatena]|uniref:SUKH-3 domain-containing protein n=1 Tax=Actinokineospora globicatena TaxID=103729 RepID=UPI0020A3B0C4|nr:SUKH-3 domain-containing protein [Actinokineospora globicatena]MCP2300624.1 SUKH-3 immunity protein [Actinokineospora globicatena]GLW81168.1 hypothetical protein Aglo01_56490 [Actinokineospora globicatena]GLW88361.1 hypothetical protein Aglo02_60000 [Actinokineospora globicatena]